MNQSEIDLSRLAVDRTTPEANSARRDTRHRISRYALPCVVLIGFVAMLLATSHQLLVQRIVVTTIPVLVKRGAVQQSGTVLFQAAGWIEPRPTSVSVPSLASGVIEELMVIEGQLVSQGDSIAKLIDVDARNAVDQAQAKLALRDAELKRAHAEQIAAEARLNHPLHLQTPLAEAESKLAAVLTEKAKLPYLIRAADANVQYTLSSLEGKRSAKDAIADVVIRQAQRDHLAAIASREELSTRKASLAREVDALNARVKTLSEQLDLLIEEKRRAEETRANVDSAIAIRDEAELQLRQAKLMLARTVIRAPFRGRILRLLSLPGMRVAGLGQSSGQHSSTIVEMYDPTRLQVRADVRLEDVPHVIPGAPVEIKTASHGKSIRGKVLQSTSAANVQKNTLETKVEILDPPETVRPEMLVQAMFLAPELDDEAGDVEDKQELLYVPRSLVETDDQGDFVWTVDAQNRAVRKAIHKGLTSEITVSGVRLISIQRD
ncbi:efflux RND transporter periplasmic adaptor subunit [Rhodopirellula sp. MGV]|uniref:efflux RND transporter periplasmic adaptor subunit n=1 Tax=Rhodopirellula sp. MGV TaxID=2023130 RepID=UPI001E4FE652|nr:HlyD family efflux transporter periplasmic adaptor subunit [Rhodopirellula sp. MGV]